MGCMADEGRITDHYEQPDPVAAIERGFAQSGKSVDDLAVDDLSIVDEFHTGGRAATEAVIAKLGLVADDTVLDIGCGLGGPARYCASRFGCRVTGIDLTPSYIDAATVLTDWVGLGDKVIFEQRAAQELALGDGSNGAAFDAAYLFHVGMNVEDKTELFSGVHRILRPGGRFAVYDLMRTDTGELTYPLPWATTGASSFVATQAAYEAGLVSGGLELVGVQDRTEIGLAFAAMISASTRAGPAGQAPAPPPVGLHLVLGSDAGTKLANLIAALDSGVLAPIEIIARRPD